MSGESEISNGLPIILSTEQKPSGRRRKSRRGRYRAAVLILVHVIIILHISHFYMSGRSVSPVEPSESMYALERGYLNAGTIFFGVAIVGTALFGRFFCGWACHVVALQDLCSFLLGRIGIRPKPLRSRFLALIPFLVAFYMFFWPTVKRLWFGFPHPGFSNHLMTENFWRTFPGPVVSVITFAVCGGLIVYLLGNKGFCTYACPYGAFFSVSDLVSVARIRVTDACQHCGQCTAACTSNVFVSREVKEFGMVVDPGCMKCMDCVSVCPNDALYYGLKAKSEKEYTGKPTLKSYDFSLAEEIVGMLIAGATIYAMRGLYDTVPLLLAVALGVITAWLFIQFTRIFRKRDLRIQNLQVKRAGLITTSGYVCIAVLSVWFALSLHSFFVQHYRYRGKQHLSQVKFAVDELFLFGRRDFSTKERSCIESALTCFQRSNSLGLADTYDVKIGLAATHMMQNNVENAEEYLRQAYKLNPTEIRELLIEFLGTQGRQEEAKEFY